MRGGARFAAVALALGIMGLVLWFVLGGDPSPTPGPRDGDSGGDHSEALPEDLPQDSDGGDSNGSTVPLIVDDVPIPADAVPVHGRVIDTAGRPVPGARVRALAATTGLEALNFLKLVEQVQNPIVSVDDTTADEAGEFTLRRVTPGMYRFLAESNTFAPRYTEPLPVAPGRSGLVEIVLSPGFPLSGTVTLESGEPVANVEISVFPNPRGEVPFIEKTTAVTGRDGRYSFGALPTGRLTGFVRPPNRPVQIMERVEIPEQSTRDVVLQGNSELRLVVTTDEGEPIVGASVTVVGRRPVQTFTFTKTDANGVVSLSNLGAGKIEMLAIIHAEFLPYPERIGKPGSEMKDVVLVEGETVEVTISLQRGLVLNGRTIDAATGEPLGGVYLRAVSSDMDLMFGADGVRSKEDGSFRLPAMRTGRSVLFAQSDTHAMPPGMSEAIRDKEVPADVAPFVLHLEEGVTPPDVVLKLRRAGTLTGRVLSPEGHPVPSASVSLSSDSFPDGTMRAISQIRKVVTDAEGRFTLDSYPPDVAFSVHATAEGWLPGSVEDITVPSGETVDGVEITLTEGITLTGEVVDESGAPVPGALVLAAPAGRRNSLNVGRSESPPARTDTEGRFVLRAQQPGSTAVRAEREGYVPATETTEIVQGQPATVRVTLPRATTITGRVVDESGAPVNNAWIRAQHGKQMRGSGGGFSGRANSGEDGTFTIDGVPENLSFDLTAGCPGFVNAPVVTVNSGSAGVEIRLQRGLQIAGRVVGPAGRGLEGMRVRVYSRERSGGRQNVTTDATGGFRVQGLQPGAHSVRVYGPSTDDLILNEDQEVQAGELGVTVNLREGLSVQGRVLDTGGKPLGGASVNASRIDEGEPSSTHHANSDEHGDFALRGMPEGNYRLIISRRGMQAHRIESIKAGTVDVVVNLSEGLAIGGTVVGKDGKSLSNARVVLRGVPPLKFFRSTRSDSEGKFRITGLEQGRYRVEAIAPGPGPRPAPSGGQDRGIEVQAGDEAVRIAVE